MDIAALSMSMAQTNLQQQVGVAMLSKSLDTADQVGNTISSMIDSASMELSVNPSVGGNFDMMV